MARRSAPLTHQEHADDALDKLLTAEVELAQRLDAARAEADELLRTAREDAASVEAACNATIATRREELAAEYETKLQTELAGIRREAEVAAVRFEALDDERLNEYVEFAIARLLEVGRIDTEGPR